MDIISKSIDEAVIIEIHGELDASSAIYLDEEINKTMQQNLRKIIVCCNNLNYISSAGLGVFISYLKEFETKNIKFVLYGLSEKVFNVFQILGLDNLVCIVDTKEEALDL